MILAINKSNLYDNKIFKDLLSIPDFNCYCITYNGNRIGLYNNIKVKNGYIIINGRKEKIIFEK